MPLDDYIERLRMVSGEGPRATEFALIQSQRGKTRKKFLDELKQAQARAIQFQAQADKINMVPVPVAGGGRSNTGAGNGRVPSGFGGKLGMYPLKGNFRMSSD